MPSRPLADAVDVTQITYGNRNLARLDAPHQATVTTSLQVTRAIT